LSICSRILKGRKVEIPIEITRAVNSVAKAKYYDSSGLYFEMDSKLIEDNEILIYHECNSMLFTKRTKNENYFRDGEVLSCLGTEEVF